MKSVLLVVLACVLVSGCQKPAAVAEPIEPSSTGAGQSGAGGVTPIGPNVGSITPVTGAENIGGTTGGGIGQAAKDSARRAANSSNTPPPGDGDQ